MTDQPHPVILRAEHVEAGARTVLLRVFGDGPAPGEPAHLLITLAGAQERVQALADPAGPSTGWRLAFPVPRAWSAGAERLVIEAPGWGEPLALGPEHQRNVGLALEALERRLEAVEGERAEETERVAEAWARLEAAEQRAAEAEARLRDEMTAHQAQRRRADAALREQEELASRMDALAGERARVEREVEELRAALEAPLEDGTPEDAQRQAAYRAELDAVQREAAGQVAAIERRLDQARMERERTAARARDEGRARQAAERRAREMLAEREELLMQLDDLSAALRAAERELERARGAHRVS